jgi:hypothetical protein
MSAVNECVNGILELSAEKQQQYIESIISQEYDMIRDAIEFNDDLFRFGGELELTKEEA